MEDKYVIRDNVLVASDPDQSGAFVSDVSGFSIIDCTLQMPDGSVRPIPNIINGKRVDPSSDDD